MTRVEVVVIGAGPGGLAAAAALKGHGVNPLVVDRAERVGSSWRRHYDRLHLHTPRRWSGLPGYPIPRSAGRWVSRDDVVQGAAELGVPLDDHIAFVLEALRPDERRLGLGTA